MSHAEPGPEEEAILDFLQAGRFAEAEEAARALASSEAERAAELIAICTVLRQPFTYGLAPMFEEAVADAEPAERSVGAVRGALHRVAGRITALRAALVDELGEQTWLPAVPQLEPIVDGTLKLDDAEGDTLQLLWLLRQEWTRLNWLLASAGARELALPEAVSPPPDRLDYLETLLTARYNLLLDVVDGRPLTLEDDLDRGMADSRWGGEKGTPLRTLGAELSAIWLEETGAALAVLRWAQGTHDSPFDAL